MTIFSILSVAVYKIATSQLNLAKRLEKRISSKHAAWAAFLYAKWKIKNDQTFYDNLYELNTSYNKKLGNAEFSFMLKDEEGKININTSSQKILSKIPGLNTDIAVSITNSSLKPFRVKEEILLLEDMTSKIFDECKNFITVYGQGPININTAPGQVLIALGMDEDLVNIIKRYLNGDDQEAGTSDDRAFESTHTITDQIRSFTMLNLKQEQTLIQLLSQQMLSVKSDNFCMDIQTEYLGKPAFKYSIVFDNEKIKEWREY